MAAQAAASCMPNEEKRKADGRTKCLLCHKPYYSPKILNCFHTFCVNCLHCLASIWTPLLGGSTQSCAIPCPLCQERSSLPEGGAHDFRDNEYVYAISEEELSALQSGTDPGPSNLVYCLVCDHKTHVGWACLECQLLLCRHCEHFHGKFKGNKDHIVYKLKDVEETELKMPRAAAATAHTTATATTDADAGCGPVSDLFTVNNHSLDTILDDYDELESVSVVQASAGTQLELQDQPQPPRLPPPPLPPRLCKYRSTHSTPTMSTAKPPHNRTPPATPLDVMTDDGSDLDYYSCNDIASSRASILPDEATFNPPVLRLSVSAADRGKVRSDPPCLSTLRLPASRIRLPPARKWPLKWPEANIQVISFSSNFVFLLGKAAQKRTKLAVFELDGTKLISKTPMPDIRTMAVLDDFNKIRLLFGEEGQALRWTSVQPNVSLDFVTISHIALDNMILSKTAPGGPAYVAGINEGHLQIQTVCVDRSTPHHLLKHRGDILAFDVSLDGTYFALLRKDPNGLMVDVFKKQGRRCEYASGYKFEVSPEKKGAGDVCFYVPEAGEREIGEILVVADYNCSQLLLLEYTKGCGVLGTVEVPSPASLAKSPSGCLWVNCKMSDGKSEILCFDAVRGRAVHT